MLFEVYNKNGKRVMYTEFKNCVPDRERIIEMMKSEYKFYLNGKILNKKAIHSLKEVLN